MGRIVLYMWMSLDGFVTGPEDGPDQGLGIGGERLHESLVLEPRQNAAHRGGRHADAGQAHEQGRRNGVARGDIFPYQRRENPFGAFVVH